MPRRLPILLVALLSIGFLGMIFMAAMMVTMMGSGHMWMMGGRGSDPAEEAAVEGVTQVRLEDFAFSPANIIVDAGTAVTWTNYDDVDHTVTSDEGDELDSPLFGEGETFSHTFDEPGQYSYHCAPHPNMRGLVTVRAAG
ncbi:MAG: cupredoxin family copper-binding protein [Dehalococcoidia bacterium]|nr:cupredoxin family copper-binding protein [Dehalococcoidia bacterium]